jgi:hypothetical protein
MGHKTHTARVMLIRCAVQTLRLQVLNFGGGRHVLLLETRQGIENTLITPEAEKINRGQIPINFLS